MNEGQAFVFAKKSIAVTSQRIGLLDESLVPRFGPTSDYALARNGKSIEWRPHGNTLLIRSTSLLSGTAASYKAGFLLALAALLFEKKLGPAVVTEVLGGC